MNQEEQTEKVFYKYSTINDHLIENLSNYQIYFSDPNNFNDIADCKFYFYFEAKKERWIKELMNQTTIPTNEALACAVIENGLKGRLKKLNRGLIRLDEDDGSIKHKKPLVSCFCEERDNLLMWGHYANSQKGACIGYKSQLINGEYKLTLDLEEEAFLKVRYRKQPPRCINLFGPDAETKTCLFVLTKFSKWKYENEYRIVLVKDEDKQKNKKTHRKEDLKSIIFGSKIDYYDAQKIYKVIKENYLKNGINIKFYRALEIPGKYELKIDLIPNMSDYIQSLQ